MAEQIPVYLFTGFLEAGKTRFIQETMQDPRFNEGDRTLLVVCEEGIEEFEPSDFADKGNVYMKALERPEDLTSAKLTGWQKQCHAQRIVLEYNGMWPLQRLFEALPRGWVIYQNFLFADAGTFLNYNANMRSLVVDKLQACELVVFNRTDAKTDKLAFHKIVRGLNRRCAIAFEWPDGHVEYDEIEDPLPFDLNAKVVEIADADFAIWYRDIVEEMDKYAGKVVRFTGLTAVSGRLPTGCFLAGRHVMTCCAEDIAYSALACEWDAALIRANLQHRAWAQVTAKVELRYHTVYGRKGPVLKVISAGPGKKPAQEVATFY
jgi:hypothetical protein